MTGADGQTLELDEMHDLLDKIKRLSQISDRREKASKDHLAANQRWNAARMEYAELHRKVVLQYGEKNAPTWVDSIHGNR